MTTASYVEPLDDVFLEMAQSRSEIMRARGYGDDSGAPLEQSEHERTATKRLVAGNAEQSQPIAIKPKRVSRKDYGRYRTPKRRVSAMPLNGNTPSAPAASNVATASALPTPAVTNVAATNVAPSLVSVVQQLTAVGLNVSMQLDGVAVAVHA